MARVVVAIALGSNVGDRAGHLDVARQRLAQVLHAFRASTVIETDPIEVVGEQTRFLNAAVVGTTEMPARDLLETLHAIEGSRGRERKHSPMVGYAPRTLDLDLILYGDRIITEPDLIVPHPRFRQRRFVLDPLVEIAPDLVDPVTGLTMSALRQGLVRPLSLRPADDEGPPPRRDDERRGDPR